MILEAVLIAALPPLARAPVNADIALEAMPGNILRPLCTADTMLAHPADMVDAAIAAPVAIAPEKPAIAAKAAGPTIAKDAHAIKAAAAIDVNPAVADIALVDIPANPVMTVIAQVLSVIMPVVAITIMELTMLRLVDSMVVAVLAVVTAVLKSDILALIAVICALTTAHPATITDRKSVV